MDPFGHSRTHAYISDRLGFSSLVLGRFDSDIRHSKTLEHKLNFIWDISCDSSIFVNVLYNSYHYPFGFEFDRANA